MQSGRFLITVVNKYLMHVVSIFYIGVSFELLLVKDSVGMSLVLALAECLRNVWK